MAKYKIVTFDVEGSGRFPVDMLRYDECFPASETDSYSIQMEFGDDRFLQRRQVTIKRWLIDRFHNPKWVPNVDRWRSMGWLVVMRSLAYSDRSA